MWIDDRILSRCHEQMAIEVWQPQHPVIVLGRSNARETECQSVVAQSDVPPILRRAGGGGTVVLYDGCAVISLGTWVKKPYANDEFFQKINQAVISALAIHWPHLEGLSQNGISDICWGARKVAGTSMFRSRNYLLYQASLIIHRNLSLIETYLSHPSKEPEYRQGRSHKSFLSSLDEIISEIKVAEVIEVLQTKLPAMLQEFLKDDLITAPSHQVEHVRAKIERDKDH
jgi:lipoate---protein ligase